MNLIDKDALVAEIERRKNKLINTMINFFYASNYNEWESVLNEYKSLISFINTLETKEVDLEEEIKSWRHNHFHGKRDKEASGEYLERVSQLDLAKYFFKLGLKAKQG